MWEKKNMTKSQKKQINDLLLKDLIKLEFLDWLDEKNLLMKNKQLIWEDHILNR